MLLVSGSLGLAVHGPRADEALAVCPPSDPWCALAAADLILFARTIGLPFPIEDAIAAAESVSSELPGPAQTRLVWAGAAPLQTLHAPADDGLTDAILAGRGTFPSGPGTWALGLGVVGASGQGAGGAVRFTHPDVALLGWQVDTTALLTSRGAGHISAAVRSPGAWWARAAGLGARAVADIYEDGERTLANEIWIASASLTPGHQRPHGAVWAGPMARWDGQPNAWRAGHGVTAGVAWHAHTDGHGIAGGAEGEVALADYAHQEAQAWARWVSGRGHFASLLRGEATPGSKAPYWRLPAAGGGLNLRHGPVARFRDESLGLAIIEARLRPAAIVGGVVFAEGAWVDGLHGGAGAGVRLRLPPRPNNTVRFDLAWGDGGLGMSAGWGEAF
jgi:hypothetical protein